MVSFDVFVSETGVNDHWLRGHCLRCSLEISFAKRVRYSTASVLSATGFRQTRSRMPAPSP